MFMKWNLGLVYMLGRGGSLAQSVERRTLDLGFDSRSFFPGDYHAKRSYVDRHSASHLIDKRTLLCRITKYDSTNRLMCTFCAYGWDLCPAAEWISGWTFFSPFSRKHECLNWRIYIIKEGLSVCVCVCIPQAPTVLDQSAWNLAWTLLGTSGVTWGR